MSMYAYDSHREKDGKAFGAEGIASVKAGIKTQCGIVKFTSVSYEENGARGIYVVGWR